MVEKMILGDQENVFLFEFGPAVLKCLFRHNFCRPPAEKLSLFTYFCSNQRFS